MKPTLPLLALVWAALPAPAAAEFRSVEQSAASLDCASCISAVSKALHRLRGVDSVELVPERNLVRVGLKPDNRVRLEEIRDALKGVGFAPTEARVRARGRAVAGQGQWQFQIEGLERPYGLSIDAEKRSRLVAGELVILEGIVPPVSDPRAQPVLQVSAVNP